MAISVSGINVDGAFCSDFGNVTLHGLEQKEISVAFSVMVGEREIFSFNETYFPNAKGEVDIRSLGEVAKSYSPAPVPPSPFSPYNVYQNSVTIHAEVDARELPLGSFEQRFFFANTTTAFSSPQALNVFLTRSDNFTLAQSQRAFLNFFYKGQTVVVRVAHYTLDVFTKTKLEIPVSALLESFVALSVGPENVLELLNAKSSAVFCIEDLIFYDVELVMNGEVADRVHYEIDTNVYPQMTQLLYFNAFGLPESVCVKGKDERISEMEATFANIDNSFVKYNTTLTTSNRVNSGYISKKMLLSLEDLVRSREVFLITDSGIGDRVTVTEIDFNTQDSREEPDSVTIRFRVADKNMAKFDRLYESGIFTEQFNDTFN